ncbi:hypothetical protein FDP41_010888 [Naegleria fowleri]|uniref:Phospholipid/glycerol acyltransferase domain-containing protein n=1 Tax=Naegleria fowleri TaxID=5763 RepID=A0A6A5CCC9_NAEFO|nr:uncharacterized protein FDP41_010888 [Naegleria fowleri]KAF0982909.1 hypothetical protein FDP41_010888 [Naegleria fowleri]
MAQVNILAYTALRWFFEFCISLFYANVSVKGTENIPKKVPVIFTVNHYNGLVDGVIIYSQVSKRIVRSVAKAELFKLPLLGTFLKLLGTIPVVRQQDITKDEEEQRRQANQAAINAMAEVLKSNDCLVIFPEGTSHNNSTLTKIKTGFARAALQALDSDEHISKVIVVPVGLNYDSKNEFRSDVFVQFGKQIIIDRTHLTEFKKDSTKLLDSLADVVRKGMQHVTVVANDPETISAAHIARSLVRKRSNPLSQEEYIFLTQKFIDVFETQQDAKQVFTTLKQLSSHMRLLNMKYSELSMRYFFIRKLLTLLLTLPITLPGSIFHLPVGLVSSYFGKKISHGYRDQEAHYILMMMIFLLPLYYIFTAIILTILFSFKFALICALLLAVSGVIAVHLRPVGYTIHLFKSFAKLLLVNREELLRIQKQLRADLPPLIAKHMKEVLSRGILDEEIESRCQSYLKMQ